MKRNKKNCIIYNMIHNIKHLFKNKNKTILFAALIALLFLSCANDLSKTDTAVTVTGIALSPDESTLSMVNGNTRQINAQVQPENATDKKLTYTSDNEGVASVTAGGLITAKAVGSAKITIKASNGISKTINVTVTAAHISVTGIVLSPDESGISLVKGTTRQINAHAVPENATDKKLTYTSDKAAIASVTAGGLITANGVGSAHITIQAADGITKGITVTVTAAHIPVTSIIFNPPLPAQPIELVIGQVYKFGAKAMPEEATNKKLTFTTSNSSIAWLCGEGNSEVKADGLGEATVTITSDDNPSVRETVHFKMKPKPEIKIKTSPAECESNGGEATFTIETLKGKLDYTPEVVEGGAKWLSVAGKDHTDESTDTVRLTVQTNKTVWNRTARIRFKDNITNEYIKISSKKYLEVQLTQKKNENPNVAIQWVHGITPPTDAEKEKIEVLKKGVPTGTYHNINYVFYWPETQTTTFFNTRKVDHTHAPNGGYPDSNQCWAKTDANMLHWWFEQNKENVKKYIEKKHITGEAAKAYEPFYKRGLEDNQEEQKSSIANLFREKCINEGGDPANGLQWYLFGLNGFKNAKNKSYSPALFPDVFNEGNTPIERAAIYTKKEFEDMLKAVFKSQNKSQKAVGLNRYGADGTQHAITLWGAAFDEDNNIIAIYVGDNNDVSNKIVPYGIWYKNGVDIYAETEPVIDPNDPHYFNPYFFNYSNNSYNDNHYIGQIITLDKGETQWQAWLDKNK
ncbi:Mac 1 [Treponema socranskii subsp. socranskii VPI DR56BR1116 = ATCC 35536]|uniref:Mac 1 n=2 Tax=Treponema socranskii TaxID=53419 RepID=U1FLE6_TRESO|nr:Mac 1 [Treponema socranskii subsp. socranskii VPI DR56BR1116 = ATCC 35536]